MTAPPDDDVLALLLRRLYARWRSRGAEPDEARREAVAEAAAALHVPAERAAAVMAAVPTSGPRRPL